MSPSPLIRPLAPVMPVTVHIVERMAPGGIETLVLDMVKGLPGAHRVVSLAGRSQDLLQAWPRLIRLGDRLDGFDKQPGLKPQLVRHMSAHLKALAPAAVVLHHIGPLLYGGLAARLARVPRILHVEHDAWHYSDARRRAVARAAFAVVRPVRIAVSDEIAAHVTLQLGATDVHVIPPGIDMDTFKPRDQAAARVRLGLPVSAKLIGTSGRLVAVKSQVTLIEALARLRNSGHMQLRLVIVGDGPERPALTQRAKDLGVADAVHLLGHRDDVAEVLPAFDVYALPSLNEGLPRSVLEAQAAGLPVVASRVGALADAVCPRSGALVPSADVAALAAALATVLASPAAPAIPRAFVSERYALSHTLAAFDRLIAS